MEITIFKDDTYEIIADVGFLSKDDPYEYEEFELYIYYKGKKMEDFPYGFIEAIHGEKKVSELIDNKIKKGEF
jgi:hypothetical protein